jgi:hypothetical protein
MNMKGAPSKRMLKKETEKSSKLKLNHCTNRILKSLKHAMMRSSAVRVAKMIVVGLAVSN